MLSDKTVQCIISSPQKSYLIYIQSFERMYHHLPTKEFALLTVISRTQNRLHPLHYTCWYMHLKSEIVAEDEKLENEI